MSRNAHRAAPASSSPTSLERTDARRFRLVSADREEALEGFAEAVSHGLQGEFKQLPCRFFYDDVGSALFEEICELAEYYPTRTERAILDGCADELAARFEDTPALVELGSGSASKTRLLIEAFLRRHGELTFVPIDISRAALRESAETLLDDYPDVSILAIEGEYERGLSWLHAGSPEPRLVAWLGSSIGNLDRDQAATFLGRLRRGIEPEERLLLGVDLRKGAAVLERAYDDRRGVTARFNKNLLARINRELGGGFDLGSFRHRAVWNGEKGRVEMHLESACDQRVRVEKLDLEVEFAEGEQIHTENSYKYSPEEIESLAERAGFALEQRWLDPEALFSVNLLAPA